MADEIRASTTAWVSLLRGINVGGHRKILMADLRTVYESLGFTAVRSYIQSGNVVFRTGERSATELVRAIEEAVADAFAFDVPVILRTADEMVDVVQDNPFLGEGADPSKLHVTFMAGAATPEILAAFGSYRDGPDELRLRGREAYLHCPGGLARTKLTPAFLERALGSASTTRNWRTVNTVLEMAQALSASRTTPPGSAHYPPGVRSPLHCPPSRIPPGRRGMRP